MRVVALIAARNEQYYIARCLRHLRDQDVDVCLIDHESTDATRAIVQTFMGRGVFRVETLPYRGSFALVEQLRLKEWLASQVDADWFIHHDADEIMQAPAPYRTLRDAIAAVDGQGYNAINFDEFTFVPTTEDEHFEGTDYVATMKNYYHFAPSPQRLIRAWKRGAKSPDLAGSGGHRASFDQVRVFPINFDLRHYIALSGDHMRKKYGSRVFCPHEVSALGWHTPRLGVSAARYRLPRFDRLAAVSEGSPTLDRSHPETKHLIFA